MRIIQAILLLILLACVLVFSLQNIQPATIRFLNWTVNAPIAFLVAAVYLLGMVSGWTVVAFVRQSIRKVGERTES